MMVQSGNSKIYRDSENTYPTPDGSHRLQLIPVAGNRGQKRITDKQKMNIKKEK